VIATCTPLTSRSPTLEDGKQTTLRDYRIRAIPTVILINRDGIVIKHFRAAGSRSSEPDSGVLLVSVAFNYNF
jgi:hypothetical protein